MQLLQLLQLTDSAIPIGSAAHSFGVETLVEWGNLDPASLGSFLRGCLMEQGVMEACYVRGLVAARREQRDVKELCVRLSSAKPARESREASIAMGNRLLHLSKAFLPAAEWRAFADSLDARHTHNALVFALLCTVLGLEEETIVCAYLQQGVAAMISVAQRLMPLGQLQAAAIQWALKPSILEAAERSRTLDYQTNGAFVPWLEVASMRHPRLETRLFVS